jgi:CHAT domain-containing protein/Tfp pilus assembly protein PilF
MKTLGRFLFILALCAATSIQADNARYPSGGFAPSQQLGGLVSIPGSPLPPLSPDSVRAAIAFYEPLLAILRIPGDTPTTARGCGYLATLYAAIGDYPKAMRLFDQAQKILESSHEPGGDLAWIHNNRGLVLLNDGKYAEGLRFFRAALTILNPAHEEYLERRVVALGNLASAYNLLGDAENSESVYFEALDILRRLGKEGSSSGQIARGNLALLYGTIGDYHAARVILEKLLAEGGLSSALRFQVLNDLGYVLSASKNFTEADRRLNQALKLTTEGTAERALVLMNLASMHGYSGDFVRSEEFGQQALRLSQRLYGESSRSAAAAMAVLATSALARGELDKADRLLVRACAVLSKESGDEEVYVFAMRAMALVAQQRGQSDRARKLSRRALELSSNELSRVLAFGSEAQRLAFRSQASPYDQLANLGDPSLLAEAVLNMKGVVIESLLAERALVHGSASSKDREQLDRIHAQKVEIMQRIRRGQNYDELARLLKTNETALAKRLAPQLRGTREAISVAAVQRKLGPGQTLIEIVLYQRYQKGGKLTPSYGGIIIPHRGPASWVPLGASEAIDRSIRTLVEAFNHRSPGRGVVSPRGHDDVAPILRELNDILWEPLSKKLPKGTSSVLISPDGATAFLPWAALVDKAGRFLAERQAIMQVGSVHDLLRDVAQTHANTLVAFGRPSAELPTLADEVNDVARLAEERGWRATEFLGDRASEGQLVGHKRPGILHLATHGGFLEESAGNRLSRNPMYRGYILLEGGEQTLQNWATGTSSKSSLDGVLTAEEAGALDLTGTWLTVLSACETGAGDAWTGEGVMGLRRGFTIAGTQHLLFTLWRVKDEPTTQFMEMFYRRLFERGDPVRAFQETQKSELLRWKRETGSISSAAYRAGAFILTR